MLNRFGGSDSFSFGKKEHVQVQNVLLTDNNVEGFKFLKSK